MGKMERPELTEEMIEEAFTMLKEHHIKVSEEKGMGAIVSSHEAVGIIQEEFLELGQVLTSGVDPRSSQDFKHELLDIAYAAIYSLASFKAGAFDF